MADDRNPLMPPDETPAPSALGGLATKVGGGLSSFFDNMNKGVDAVLSHPLYATAWSGMVSGMTGDPTSGPMALTALRQAAMSRQAQQQQMDMQREESDIARFNREHQAYLTKRLRIAAARGDRSAMEDIYSEIDPQGFLKMKTSPPPSRGAPVQVLRNGKPGFAYPDDAVAQGLQPIPRGALVENNINPAGLTNASLTNLQTKEINVADTLGRLNKTIADFKPEFQTWGNRINMAALSSMSSLGIPLGAEDEKNLSEFASYRATAFNNMSYVLNQLSGAAISPSEAERLKMFLPNPGTGLLDGDSPTVFQAKMKNFDKELRDSMARYKSLGDGTYQMPTPRTGGVSAPQANDAAPDRPRPDGVPDGSRYDAAGHMWITPDGRVLVED